MLVCSLMIVGLTGVGGLVVVSNAGDVRSASTANEPPLSLTVHFTDIWSWLSIAVAFLERAVTCRPPSLAKGTFTQCGLDGQDTPAIGFTEVVRSSDADACDAGATGSLQAATRPNRPVAHTHETFRAILIRASFRWVSVPPGVPNSSI